MRLVYHPKVHSEDIPRLGPDACSRIAKAVALRLLADPEKYSLPLRRGLSGYRKMRVGDWRVIFRVAGGDIRIIIIGHRSDVYRRIAGR